MQKKEKMLELLSYKWGQAALSFIHTISGIMAILFGNGVISDVNSNIALTRQKYLDRRVSIQEETNTVNLFYLIAIFSLITGVAHGIYFMDNVNHPYKESPLSVSYRFLEYSLSAPIMMVVIAVLVGVTNNIALLSISGLVATTMLFGYIEEECVKTDTLRQFWSPWLLGFVPFAFCVVAVLWSYTSAVIDSADQVPGFVHGIIATQIILFSSFGFVQGYYITLPSLRGQKSLDAKRVREMDGAYHLLSLTAKMLLVWMSIGGVVNM